MKIIIHLAVLIELLFMGIPSFACTSAIVSGRFTRDGRPLLWKNRDASDLDNKLMYFADGKFDYIGLVNARDSLGNEVWIGMNSAGFAIMNTASYNLNTNDTTQAKDKEGFVIKLALQQCATVNDFEALLNKLRKPYGVEANFGVIDAKGNGAYFETSNYGYTKIDVNDPTVAPMGYLIRTNYSFSGVPDQGQGYIRYETAKKIFYNASATGKLGVDFLVHDAPRCLYHSLTETDLNEMDNGNPNTSEFVWFADYIPRSSTAASVVIQGVKKGEKPEFTTMWTTLGFPLCSVVYPVWLNHSHSLPSLLQAGHNGHAPLCDKALTLKKQCIPIVRGHGENYMNINALLNKAGTGILQKLRPLDEHILNQSEATIEKWRLSRISDEEVQEFYNTLDRQIRDAYREMFGI